MWSIYIHIFVCPYLFLFRFNLLETAKFIDMGTMPVVLFSLSSFTPVWRGFYCRRVISVYRIIYVTISLTLYALHISVFIPLVFRGLLCLGYLRWCMPLLSTTMQFFILLGKSSCVVIIFFSIIDCLITLTLISFF